MNKRIVPLIIILAITVSACEKYLDEKPNKKQSIPTTVEDCQAILDNNNIINSFSNNAVGEVSADNYYLTSQVWAGLSLQSYRDMYVWGNEIFYDNSTSQNDWNTLYSVVYKANVILDVIQKAGQSARNNPDWNNVLGSALFLRAEAFSVLARSFAKAYSNGSQELGIVLRLTSDFNVVSERATVEQTYSRIISDLLAAIPYLPEVPTHVMRPSRPAAYGLLARVYLSMRDYPKAALYSDSCLQIKNTLIDYNSVSVTATLPFALFGPETIYFAQGSATPLANTRARIDSFLYLSYASNDLRKSLFFKSNGDGSYGFKGNYTGSATAIFVGVATDEMYLTKAEAICRNGDYQEAMKILNALLINRWRKGTFTSLAAGSQSEALSIILNERRKELLMRDLRWIDIKRLNLENANISLKRIVNNTSVSLAPNDNKFALPLPATVIAISHMTQNPR